MSGYLVAVLGACLVLGFMIEPLRRRRLREKYAALWIGVSVLVLATVALPGVLRGVAAALGVTVPLNLVFFGSLILLLIVSIQLSAEITSLQRQVQTLAEEVALIRHRLEVLERVRGEQPGSPVADLSPTVPPAL
ncbi:MAG TPA: DUF2304 domain-containing protein [Cellulomonas sp.]